MVLVEFLEIILRQPIERAALLLDLAEDLVLVDRMCIVIVDDAALGVQGISAGTESHVRSLRHMRSPLDKRHPQMHGYDADVNGRRRPAAAAKRPCGGATA